MSTAAPTLPVTHPFPGDATSALWEGDSGTATIHSDNAWLLSFIDILALLLTLFVLLLAYETRGSDAGNPEPPAQQEQAVKRAKEAPPAAKPAAPAQLQVPLQLPGAAPRVIALPLPLQTGYAAPRVIDLPLPARVTTRDTDVQIEAATPSGPDHAAADAAMAQLPPAANPADEDASSQHPAMPAPEATLIAKTPPETLSVDATEAVAPEMPAAAIDQQRLLAALAGIGLHEQVEVAVQDGVVNLQISDSILFEPGSSALTAAGSVVLGKLATTLAGQAHSLSVEGHTDNLPIQTDRYPSNWELSSARAAMVTRQLIEQGMPAARVRAIGYGDTRPRADNGTAQGRAKNRRVSFVLQVAPASHVAD